MSRILVVDDEQSMREMLGIMLRKEGYEVVVADSRAQAAGVLGHEAIDMVVTDVRLPDGDGIEILRHVKAASPETIVIVMTAFGTTETAVAARKLGAEAYVLKPFDVDELRIVVRDALANRRLREENVILKREVGQLHGLDHVIGTSTVMASLFEMVRAVAPTSSTVLITGESGTGKELVARAIHGLSRTGVGGLRQHQLRGAPGHPARERAVRAHQGRLHRRRARARRVSSRPPTAGRCSSTRWGRRRPRCRSSSCARSRRDGSVASAAPTRSTWTCG